MGPFRGPFWTRSVSGATPPPLRASRAYSTSSVVVCGGIWGLQTGCSKRAVLAPYLCTLVLYSIPYAMHKMHMCIYDMHTYRPIMATVPAPVLGPVWEVFCGGVIPYLEVVNGGTRRGYGYA